MLVNIATGVTLTVCAEENEIFFNEQWVNSEFSNADSSKLYKVNVPSDGIVNFTMMHYMAIGYNLYNEDLSDCVGRSWSFYGTADSPTTDKSEYCVSAGIYYLKFYNKDYKGDSHYGKYKIKASFQSFYTNEIEPNNYDTPMSVSLNSNVTGAFTEQDRVDWYKFVISENQNIQISFLCYTSFNFKLYNSDLSNEICSKWQSGGDINSPTKSSYEFSLKSGEYYIYLSNKDYRGDFYKGKYNIDVSVVNDVTQNSSLNSSSGSINKKVKKPKKPTIKTPSTNKKHKITAKWSRVSGCDGYQVQFSTKSNFKKNLTKKTVSSQKKTSCTVKLKKGKKYYIRVRAYKTVNGERYYSSWSKTKSIKCK